MIKCPKCRGSHVDAFSDGVYWFLCRECGYNSPAYHDLDRAVRAFVRGQDPNAAPMDVWDGIEEDMRNVKDD